MPNQMVTAERVTVEDVLAVSDGPVLVCEIAGRRVGIPYACIEAGSEVHGAGDRGKLVIPVELARNLGLA